MPKKILIYTDLDGTLLDRDSYSPAAALAAVKLAISKNVPIIFCSSKTRAEQLVHRKELGITDPFIVEDGGAIFFEEAYFANEAQSEAMSDGLRAIKLGADYETIRSAIEAIRAETALDFKGYADLTVEQVAEVTGLSLKAASLARMREFEETIVTPMSTEDADLLREKLRSRDLQLSRGGRFYAVTGETDKGMAVRKLTELFRSKLGDVTTVGIGDSANDLPMLAAVEQPILVQKSDGIWEENTLPNLRRVAGIGPSGWSEFVTELLGD